jgi:23S rRNA pseudouridine2605 synthase
MRLNKYLAHSGVASRREADELIKKGYVRVNGEVIREMGFKVEEGASVEFRGRLLKPARHVYILLNKPKDYITTTSDEKDRKTVLDLVRDATKETVYPVGRLDRNTTGLLLLTNDGDLTQQLTHPSSEVRKLYLVTLNRPLAGEHLSQIEKGIELDDGPINVDEIAYVEGNDRARVGVELHSGRNRIVRRIFEHFGYEVKSLDRLMFAGLTKKSLPRGKWRMLTDKEVVFLKRLKSKPQSQSPDAPNS